MGGHESDWDLLWRYHNVVGVDVGRYGTALAGVPITTADNVDSLPYAARYLHCPANATQPCRQGADPEHKYCATCWIPRSDIPKPLELFPNLTTTSVPHQYDWNPGWRQHQ